MGAVAMLLVCLLVMAGASSASAEATVFATGNPHITTDSGASTSSRTCGAACVLPLINEQDVIRQPMTVQQDTHLRTIHVKTHGGNSALPLYLFKQSPRLSARPLPFKLVLTHSTGVANALEVPVPAAQAWDSWFPGYQWSLMVCHDCQSVTHLGWKFTHPDGSSFNALIVDYKESEEGIQSAVGNIAEKLRVGMQAPAWVVALLSAHVLKPAPK